MKTPHLITSVLLACAAMIGDAPAAPLPMLKSGPTRRRQRQTNQRKARKNRRRAWANGDRFAFN